MSTKTTKSNSFNYVVYIIALIMSIAVSGCGGGSKVQYSGFLDDYSKMRPIKGSDGVRWVDTNANLSKYKKIMIDPVTFYIGPTKGNKTVTPKAENINRITNYFRQALIRELSKDYEIVDTAGTDVGRIRAAITTVEVNRKELSAYQYLPITLVATGAAEVAGARNRIAVVNFEAEYLDSLTGRQVAAAAHSRSQEVTVKDAKSLTQKDVQKILDFWANQARVNMVKFTKK